MQIFRIHVNSWFIINRSAKVALRLVQKLDRDKQSKMYLKFAVFSPCYPLFIFFDFFLFFRNVDDVEWNRMPFEF